MSRRNWRPQAVIGAGFVLSACFLWLALRNVDGKSLGDAFAAIRYTPVILCAGALSLGIMLRAVRFLRNRELLGDLSRATWETVRALMAEAAGDPGVRPGMVVVPQTFGSSVNPHPHVHAIVSRGAWTTDGTWLGATPSLGSSRSGAERMRCGGVAPGRIPQTRDSLMPPVRTSPAVPFCAPFGASYRAAHGADRSHTSCSAPPSRTTRPESSFAPFSTHADTVQRVAAPVHADPPVPSLHLRTRACSGQILFGATITLRPD